MAKHIWRPASDYGARSHTITCIHCKRAIYLNEDDWARVCEDQTFEAINLGQAIKQVYIHADAEECPKQRKTRINTGDNDNA